MAEALLRVKAGDYFVVDSAGLYAIDGASPALQAKQVLAEKGIKLDHTSQRLDENLLYWADVLLTMTEEQKHEVQQQYPPHIEKVYTLKEYNDECHDFQKLQTCYAELETKRALYQTGANDGRWLMQEAKHVEQEIERLKRKIQDLEDQQPSYNIHDPLGGTAKQYQHICDDIEKEVDRLIAKAQTNE